MDYKEKDGFELVDLDEIYADYNDRERTELEAVEKGARLVADLNDGVVPNSEFMDKAGIIVEEYKKNMCLGSLDIDMTMSFIRKILVRASKIKRVHKMKRKKKSPPDERSV